VVGTKHNFLKTVRLIAKGPWNTLLQLQEDLSPKRPPPRVKQKRFNWKQEFETVLRKYKVS